MSSIIEFNPNRKRCWELSLSEEDTTITAPNINYSASICIALITGKVFHKDKTFPIPDDILEWAKAREDQYFTDTMNAEHKGLTKELKKLVNI